MKMIGLIVFFDIQASGGLVGRDFLAVFDLNIERNQIKINIIILLFMKFMKNSVTLSNKGRSKFTNYILDIP